MLRPGSLVSPLLICRLWRPRMVPASAMHALWWSAKMLCSRPINLGLRCQIEEPHGRKQHLAESARQRSSSRTGPESLRTYVPVRLMPPSWEGCEASRVYSAFTSRKPLRRLNFHAFSGHTPVKCNSWTAISKGDPRALNLSSLVHVSVGALNEHPPLLHYGPSIFRLDFQSQDPRGLGVPVLYLLCAPWYLSHLLPSIGQVPRLISGCVIHRMVRLLLLSPP